MVSLEMAKKYLRVDSSDDDEYIQSLITTIKTPSCHKFLLKSIQ
jgi:hypothetical protein